MTKRRSTKHALFSSVLSLFLCFAMLLGTTFAWFTDSVSSANNIITSGNLDVELYYQVKNEDGTWTSWNEFDSDTNVFKDKALWEPGYTEIVRFKVVNEGTLALKYQLGVGVTDETKGTNVDGNTFKLSDYIKYGILEGNADYTRDTAIAAAETVATPLSVSYGSDTLALLAGEEDLITMVVYMPTTVGNVVNYKKGTAVPTINLGINVFATQFSYEDDSFDNKYDAGSPWLSAVDTEWYTANPDATEYVIYSPEELAGLAQLVNSGISFSGKTVKLYGDIDLNNREWTPIGTKTAPFKGTFDGQGHTVSNLSINTPDSSYAGIFGYVYGGTVKNVNVNNVSITAYSYTGSIVGRVYTGTVQNCHVTGSVKLVSLYAYAGGIVGGDYVTLSNCSVIADGMGEITVKEKTGAGGICGWHTEGPYVLSNCHVKNVTITAWANIGGITGFVHYGNTISDCSVENVVMNKTRVDGNGTIGLAAGGWSYSSNNAITIVNNSFKNITLNGNYVYYASTDVLYGGEYGGNASSNFVLDNNAQSGITNNLVRVEKISDGFIKTTTGTYMIYNSNGLYAFAESVNKYSNYEYPYQGETVLLLNDIDLGGAEWVPIGDYRFSANRFCGTFDGQGYTISNFQITKKTDKNDSNKSSYGFFGNVEGTVKNLTVANATVSSYAYCGALIGRLNSGLVENCHVINSHVAPSYWQGGIMIGQVNGGTVKNCTVSNSTITGKSALGGMFGPVTAENGDLLFENCTVKTSAVIQSGSFGGNYDNYFGGLFGYLDSGDNRIDVNNCDAINTAIKGEVSLILSGDNEGNIYFNGAKCVFSVAELNTALSANQSVIIAANIENATVKLPSTLENVTISALPNVVIKNSTISAADGNSYSYEGLTFDGITFDNSRLLFTGWRTGEETIKDLTITNCVFRNLDDTTNTAAVHVNKDASKAVNGFVFTNNVIDGATGGSKSGIYTANTGKVIITGNTFNNIVFRPVLLQIADCDGIADEIVISDNVMSNTTRLQVYGSELDNGDGTWTPCGTDTLSIAINENIFKNITTTHYICTWGINGETDISHNYFDTDLTQNLNRIYWNNIVATNADELATLGVYPFYTALNADGTINTDSLVVAD